MSRWFSFAYIAVVLGLGLVNLWPRLTVRFAHTSVVASVQPVRAVAASNAASTSLNTPSTLKAGPATPTTAPVNLNTASQAEIESLPGVGPALAQRIVDGRPYRILDDLDQVKGIGPRLLERLRPLVLL